MPARRHQDDPRIRQLETDLFYARCALVDLMPEAVRKILGSYRTVKTTQDWFGWSTRAAEQIAELAENVVQRTYQGHPVDAPRAKCPLCGAGPQSFYDDHLGFALPEGLVRHLTGGSNARQCPVFGAAYALARDYIRDPVLGPKLDL